jgi:hypothetical protein
MDRVLVETAQGVTPVDFDRIGQFPQTALSDATRDMLYSSLCYAGLQVTQSGGVNVQVALGRVYSGGDQYHLNTVQERSIAEAGVPTIAGSSVIHLLVAQGQEIDDALENRYYERDIDPNNPNAGTQQTVDDAYRVKRRRVVVTVIPGQPGVRPVAPVAPIGSVAVAEILVTTSGIQSVTMREDTRATRLDAVVAQQRDVLARLDLTDQAIAGLRIDLAAVRADLLASASAGAMAAMQVDIALIKDSLDFPDDGSPYWANRFLTLKESAYDIATGVGHPDWDARVSEGIRFPDDNKSEFQLSIYAPNDPNLRYASSGLICPKFTEVPGISLEQVDGEMPLGGVVTTNLTLEHLTQSRERVRYGSPFTVCNNSQFWASGKFDPIAGIFTSATGETFKAAAELFSPITGDTVNHQYVRLQQFWKDEIEVPYDKYTPNQTTITGVTKAQTFLQHQERWVTRSWIGIKRWGAGAAVTAIFCECDAEGRPDPTRVFNRVDLTAASFQAWPAKTYFTYPKPVFTAPLSGGNGRARPYATIWATTGDVDVVTADGQAFLGGNLFTTTDGYYWDGDLTRDICHGYDYANFDITDMPVRLGGWNLSGGIEALDVLAPMITPGAASATFQVNVGGAWRSLDKSESGISFLNGTQVGYDAQVLLRGTEWAMPIIDTTGSRVRLSRPKAQFTWVGGGSAANSYAWQIGSAATQLKLQMVVSNWDAARHTITPRVYSGAGFTTATNAAGAPTVRVVAGREVGRPDQSAAVIMEWTFNLASAASAVVLWIRGNTNNYKIPFLPEWACLRKTA